MNTKVKWRTTSRFVLKMFSYAKLLTAFMFFLVLSNTIFMYIVPIFTQKMVDGLLQPGKTEVNLALIAGYIVILLLSVVCSNLERYIAVRHEEVVGDRFRNDFFRILFRKNYVEFNRSSYGDIETAMTSCIEDINDAAYCFVETLIVYPIGIVLGISYISGISGWLLLVLLAQLLLNYFIMHRGSMLLNQTSKESYQAQSRYFSVLASLHHAYENIRLLFLLPRADQKHKKESSAYAKANIKMAGVNSLQISMLLDLSDAILNIAVIFLFYHLIRNRQSTIGAYLAFMAMKEAISGNINGFIKLKANKAQFDAAFEQIDVIEPIESFLQHDFTSAQRRTTEVDGVALRQVEYAYPNNPQKFMLDYEFKKHGCYLLTGENGMGKSTFVRLLTNLLEDNAGICTGDAVIQVLPQNLQIFDDDIIDLILDENTAFSEEIAADFGVLKQINRIQKPPAGEKSLTGSLSGGEKKKILLSLLLGQKSDVLILDEPFAEIDSESKELLAKLIRKAALEKTVILITHEIPPTLKDSAIILRMDKKEGTTQIL